MQSCIECDACQILTKMSLAEKFCIECEENLCIKCVEEHARRKATAIHKLFLISQNSRQVGIPRLSNLSADEITLTWNPPDEEIGEDDYYQICFREVGRDSRWRYFPGEFKTNKAVLNGLKSNTSYKFRVRAVYVVEEGPFSSETDQITTCQSQAFRMANNMGIVWSDEISPAIIPVPRTKLMDPNLDAEKIQNIQIGEDNAINGIETKVIMLVGATGSGKSTLVDGFINYVMGVNWRDSFRFTTTTETSVEKNKINKAHSHEDWITCYTINPEEGSRLKYQLKIIDTPGFGDTRGIERDQRMVEQIQILFSKLGTNYLTHIDAVCFVLKAPDSRLTLHQRYIFQLIMSMLGNDIGKNICSLITFADGNDPPVLAGMNESGLPFGCTFNFNNCALFVNNKEINATSFSPIFWEISMLGFRSFFQHIEMTPHCSLDKTRMVLQARLQINSFAKQLQPIIDEVVIKIERIKQDEKTIVEKKKVTEIYKDFEICETEEKQRRRDVPRGQHVTNCLNCNITCHMNCTCSPGDKLKCKVMDHKGYCTKCPNKCYWQQHVDNPYIFETISVTVKKTLNDKKQKYLDHFHSLTSMESCLNKLKKDIKDVFHKANLLMNELQTSTDKLNELALQVSPFMMCRDHIDVLLQNEKLERKDGFMKRITMLKEIQKRAELLQCFKQVKEEIGKI